METDGDVITLQMSQLDPNVLLTFSQFAPLPKHLLDGVNPADYEPLRWSDGINHPSDKT